MFEVQPLASIFQDLLDPVSRPTCISLSLFLSFSPSAASSWDHPLPVGEHNTTTARLNILWVDIIACDRQN